MDRINTIQDSEFEISNFKSEIFYPVNPDPILTIL
jgi:hypothetical protein